MDIMTIPGQLLTSCTQLQLGPFHIVNCGTTAAAKCAKKKKMKKARAREKRAKLFLSFLIMQILDFVVVIA